jgi:hypothetical protein
MLRFSAAVKADRGMSTTDNFEGSVLTAPYIVEIRHGAKYKANGGRYNCCQLDATYRVHGIHVRAGKMLGSTGCQSG